MEDTRLFFNITYLNYQFDLSEEKISVKWYHIDKKYKVLKIGVSQGSKSLPKVTLIVSILPTRVLKIVFMQVLLHIHILKCKYHRCFRKKFFFTGFVEICVLHPITVKRKNYIVPGNSFLWNFTCIKYNIKANFCENILKWQKLEHIQILFLNSS